jgi:hypothetical protein
MATTKSNIFAHSPHDINHCPVASQIRHGNIEIESNFGVIGFVQRQIRDERRLQKGSRFPQKQDGHQYQAQIGQE